MKAKTQATGAAPSANAHAAAHVATHVRAKKRKGKHSSSRAAASPKDKLAQKRKSIASWLQLGLLRSEKCELQEAFVAYTMALQKAKKLGDLRSTMEALSGLLRLAGEALDENAIERWDCEL